MGQDVQIFPNYTNFHYSTATLHTSTMQASKNLGIIFLPVISNLVAVNSLKDEIFHPPGVSGDATPLFPLDAGNTEGYIRMIRSGPALETVHNKGILRSLRSSPGPHTLAASRARR